jgi:hypothetical protein
MIKHQNTKEQTLLRELVTSVIFALKQFEFKR